MKNRPIKLYSEPENARSEEEQFRATVGKRLRIAEKRFSNRAEAAAAAGVSRSTFQYWIEGRSDPSFYGLARFADKAGLSLEWLAGGEAPPNAADLSVAYGALTAFLRREGLDLDPDAFGKVCALLLDVVGEESEQDIARIDRVIAQAVALAG